MIEHLAAHRDYKASPEPWLSEIPSHWRMARMKHLLQERAEKGHPEEPLLAATQTMGVVRKDRYESRTVVATKDLHLLKLVKRGDFVISLRSFQGGIEFARDQGIISPAYTIVFTEDDSLRGYLAALFKSRPFIGNLSLYVTGIRQGQNIDYDKLCRSLLPVPPPDEQAAIVRFLAEADRRIHRLIRNKRRLIELLNEQKQAIITQAVTRGLDPSVPMQASGIKEVGDIPEHWGCDRFKRQVGFQEGPGIMAADFREDGVPLLRISCVSTPDATLNGCNFLDPMMVASRWAHFRVRQGDYLLTASGSTGVVSRATEEVLGAIPYTGIIRLWDRHGLIDMEYVRYYLQAEPFKTQMDLAKSGVGIEHFGPTHLRRMWMACPGRREQAEIVAHIEDEIGSIRNAAARASAEIDFLREYRTRLVADVVTGKLDVRAAAKDIPIPTDTEPDVAEGLDEDFELDAGAEELEEEIAT